MAADVLAIEAALKALDAYDTFQHQVMCFAGGKPLPYEVPKTATKQKVGQKILASAYDLQAMFKAKAGTKPN